jgi:hypothetical protein
MEDTMKRNIAMTALSLLILAAVPFPSFSEDATYDTYKDRFAIDVPGMGAIWVGVKQKDGYLQSDTLWGGGSVVPNAYTGKLDAGDMLGYILQRAENIVRERDANRKPTLVETVHDNMLLNVSGNYVEGTYYRLPRNDKDQLKTIEFSGKKIPAVPSAPDLSAVKYGDPVELFNGKDLSGWKLTSENQTNGWSVKNGELHNDPVQKPGEHISYGNLRTEAEFEDFNLKLEVSVPENGNSGVYLRGIYEVQVADTYGKPLDSHNMGGVYSRITPTEAAEKPAGEWQTMDITLVDRHITVILNGKKIIDNKPVLGCTGGALTSNEFKPGPIYLQGDHEAVTYRNVILTPVVK